MIRKAHKLSHNTDNLNSIIIEVIFVKHIVQRPRSNHLNDNTF